MAAGGFHYLENHPPLTSKPYSLRAQLALQTTLRIVIDALAGGDAMCGSG
jgi:hypothetical protein